MTTVFIAITLVILLGMIIYAVWAERHRYDPYAKEIQDILDEIDQEQAKTADREG